MNAIKCFWGASWRKILGGILTIFSITSLLLLFVSKNEWKATNQFDLTIEAELGEDRGQGMGTLFEARDANGRLLLGAGFQDSYSTNVRDNNRMLSFFCTVKNDELQFRSLGKPFGPKANAARIIADNGVFAFMYGDPIRIDEIQSFGSDLRNRDTSMPKGLLGLQCIGEKRLLMINRENKYILLLGEKVMYSAAEYFQFYYSNGIVAFFYYNPPRIYIGPWNISKDPLINPYKLKKFSIDGVPFAFGKYRDELIIPTNIGGLYSYKNGDLNVIRRSDGKSFQIYSIINVNDYLILGHYPSGSLYIYGKKGLRKFKPPIPVPENANDGEREVQTLTLFGGQLYAGVWPWGEIWRLDLDSLQWHFVVRLFNIPEMSAAVSTPYEIEMLGGEDVFNYWGQRIVSMVPFSDAMYISTMNKYGGPYDPDRHPFVNDDSVQQYGQIYRLWGPLQVTVPFLWRYKTSFRFKIASGKLELYQDGVLLAEMDSTYLLDGFGRVDRLTVGEGLFGAFGGLDIFVSE